MQVVTISGKARHGKDTSAELMKKLFEEKGLKCYIYHYADPVKMCAKNYFGWSGEKDAVGRTLLQNIGTDRARAKCMSTWTDFAKQIIERVLFDADVVIIPDCRFPNEIECWEGKAISVHVTRTDFESNLTEEQKNHPSENALNDYIFNYFVEAKDLEELSDGINIVANDIIEGRI